MAVQLLWLCFPMQRVWVWSLVGELGSHMPHSQNKTKQNIKQKQYCNKLNKDFKKWSTSKKTFLKMWIIYVQKNLWSAQILRAHLEEYCTYTPQVKIQVSLPSLIFSFALLRKPLFWFLSSSLILQEFFIQIQRYIR